MKTTNSFDKNLIYDIGMHVGQDTKYYLEKGFRVVAVEANPVLAKEASMKFKNYIEQGSLIIIDKGIANGGSTAIPFYINNFDSAWSSFIEDIGSRGGSYETININVTSIPSLFEQHGYPYYLKIDIEGLDYDLIKSLRNVTTLPPYISAENGQEHMIRELVHLGYQSFKFINQAHIGGRHSIIPSKEGITVDFIFDHGASGEFGEDTPGEWMPMDAVIEISNRYWSNPLRDANIDGWYDVHARIF